MPQTRQTWATAAGDVTVLPFIPPQPKAGVVLLYGSDGLSDGGVLYRELARQLSVEGFATIIPDYFEPTGITRSNPDLTPRHFKTWMGIILDIIDAARARLEVSNLGLLGVSLGAWLALSVAAKGAPVGAVVDFFGGLPDKLRDEVQSMPPVLILHGALDKKVSVQEAHMLEKLLQERGWVYERCIYEDQGHGFKREAATDSMARTVRFLSRHLLS